MQEDLRQLNKLEIDPSNLKDILLHSIYHKDMDFEVTVPFSRFRKILSDYYNKMGVSIDGLLENYSKNYDFFIMSGLDSNGNTYKIIKDFNSFNEVKSKCKECNCQNKRWINKKTGICYYKEMITKNYTTKIQ